MRRPVARPAQGQTPAEVGLQALDFSSEEETKMANKCNGQWSLTLVFDKDQHEEDDGFVDIEEEDADGVFAGKHTSSDDNAERPLRKGKCKDNKISFERDHEDGGVIVYTDGVVGEDSLSGKFRIVGGNFAGGSEGDESEGEGQGQYKDKDKDKDKDPGDTGTWTGVKEGGPPDNQGLPPDNKDKKSKKDEGDGGGGGQYAQQKPQA